jgi:ribosomal RNA assembly protein
MDYFVYSVKVPQDRVEYIKKNLKKILNDEDVEIEIKDNEIILKSEDSWKAYKLKNILEAIGRGFEVDKALLLKSDDYAFEIIDIPSIIRSKAPNQLERVRARVIGTKGRAKRNFESLGECHLSIKGKTVSIIGDSTFIDDVREAIEMLIRGAPHSRVYRWLEQKKKQRRFYSMLEYEYRQNEHDL